MNCKEYKRLHPRFSKLPLARKTWDTPAYEEWADHIHRCRKCSDWSQKESVRKRGHNPGLFPCVHIAFRVTQECKEHGDLCADIIVRYMPKFDEYFIGDYRIQYCPWCGKKLPASKRDLWFDTLEKMGITEVDDKRIPKRFKSGAWYSRRKAPSVGRAAAHPRR